MQGCRVLGLGPFRVWDSFLNSKGAVRFMRCAWFFLLQPFAVEITQGGGWRGEGRAVACFRTS